MNQSLFEQRCVEQLKFARAEAQAAGAQLDGDNGAEPTIENLCWKLEDGSYGVRAIQSAWVGYQWGLQDAACDVMSIQQDLGVCDFI